MCSIVKKHNLLCEKISLVCKFCPPHFPFLRTCGGGLPSFNKGGLLKLVLHQGAENAAFNSPKRRHNYIWNRWKGPWTVIVTWIANARFIKPKRYCMLLLRCCSQHNGKCFFLHWPACKGIKRHKKKKTDTTWSNDEAVCLLPRRADCVFHCAVFSKCVFWDYIWKRQTRWLILASACVLLLHVLRTAANVHPAPKRVLFLCVPSLR